jgi:RNA polymerase sigma factor (sigma-70 family)
MIAPGHASPARLSRGEEVALVLAAQGQPGPARDRLVDACMPLVGSIALTYAGTRDVNRRELMQEGVVGVLRALHRYDPAIGTSFWAYASWWVRQAMQQLVSELGRPIVLSDRALRQLARIRAAQRRFAQEHGREATTRELAAATEFDVEHVQRLLSAVRIPRSLEEPLGGADGDGRTLGEQVADPSGEEAYERVPFRVACRQLAGLLATLDERERTVLCARYGLGVPARTLREIGATLGVSAERVRQIEQESLRKCLAAAHDEATSALAPAPMS